MTTALTIPVVVVIRNCKLPLKKQNVCRVCAYPWAKGCRTEMFPVDMDKDELNSSFSSNAFDEKQQNPLMADEMPR